MSSLPIVLILTGPCGVGKTSIGQQLAKELNMIRISGDEIKEELFPEVSDVTEFPDKLQIVKQAILAEAKGLFEQGESVIIDYVILGKSYYSQFRETFGEQLIIKVLLPSPSIIYERDLQRSCWTSGRACIDELYQKFADLKDVIGVEHFHDNGRESVEESVQRLKDLIILHSHQLSPSTS